MQSLHTALEWVHARREALAREDEALERVELAIGDLVAVTRPDPIESPVSLPAEAEPGAAVDQPGPVETAAPEPAIEQPGQELPDAVVRDTGGRVGQPPAPVPTSGAECPDCGKFMGSAANVGRHRRFCRGQAPTQIPVATTDEKDPREIRESCPKCAKPFTWRPSLESHIPVCRGAEAVANRGA